MEPGVGGRLVAPAADPPGASRVAPPAVTVTRAPTASRFEAVAFEPERQRAAALGPVVEVGQRAVLGEDQEVDPAVVVEVAGGQPAADAGGRARAARRRPVTSTSRPPGAAERGAARASRRGQSGR